MPASTSGPRSVTIQSIVYRTDPDAIERTLDALDNSARVGLAEGSCESLRVVLGDASPEAVLTDADVSRLAGRFEHLAGLDYHFFDANTGTARGHNRLAREHDGAYIVTSNPDVVPDARALWRMLELFDDGATGMVEAKQLPVEHPKEYDDATGETSWAATAFAMTSRTVFDLVGGFDEQTFFMYCDDVDYSWLVREAGYAVRFQPAAVVFHDKRLTNDGHWQPTDAEHYFSAQASLLLAHKWSREDVVEQVSQAYAESEVSQFKEALEEFERRRAGGELVPQRDPEHLVATFLDGFYARHRYPL